VVKQEDNRFRLVSSDYSKSWPLSIYSPESSSADRLDYDKVTYFGKLQWNDTPIYQTL